MLFEGAVALLKAGQGGSGGDLGCYLLDVLAKAEWTPEEGGCKGWFFFGTFFWSLVWRGGRKWGERCEVKLMLICGFLREVVDNSKSLSTGRTDEEKVCRRDDGMVL